MQMVTALILLELNVWDGAVIKSFSLYVKKIEGKNFFLRFASSGIVLTFFCGNERRRILSPIKYTNAGAFRTGCNSDLSLIDEFMPFGQHFVAFSVDYLLSVVKTKFFFYFCSSSTDVHFVKSISVMIVLPEMAVQPFKRQSHKIVKHTQTIRRQFADELFECVWPFRDIGA